MADDALGAVADELYGLPAADFTAARNAAAKAAKANKERDLAAGITALPRPSTSAWVVNQLVRRHPDDVAALLELGADMRAAEHARDADRIRSLSRERNLRVPALTKQARALSEELGQPVSEAIAQEIESTLTAALATEDFGSAVRSGQLTKALVWAGFGEMPALATLVAVPTRTESPKREKKQGKASAEDRAAAEEAAREAEEAAREAEEAAREAERREREQAEAEEAAAEAESRVAELTAVVEDLTQQLDWAKKQLSEATKEAKDAARRVKQLS
jgi:methyl-accepting chemotaxis protein